MGTGKEKKKTPEVKILDDYCLEKMQNFPPGKVKTPPKKANSSKTGGRPSLESFISKNHSALKQHDVTREKHS